MMQYDASQEYHTQFPVVACNGHGLAEGTPSQVQSTDMNGLQTLKTLASGIPELTILIFKVVTLVSLERSLAM
jgi:hypothetical protein